TGPIERLRAATAFTGMTRYGRALFRLRRAVFIGHRDGPALKSPFPASPVLQTPPDPRKRSAAANWAPLARFIEGEARTGQWAQRRWATAFAYEFIRFGIKQGWACLFGGAMVALIVGTHLWYPRDGTLGRYDFMFLAALAIQAAMLAFKFETWEE